VTISCLTQVAVEIYEIPPPIVKRNFLFLQKFFYGLMVLAGTPHGGATRL
jgi:hypothetical protein